MTDDRLKQLAVVEHACLPQAVGVIGVAVMAPVYGRGRGGSKRDARDVRYARTGWRDLESAQYWEVLESAQYWEGFRECA
jgi:hypothetical protein